MKKSRKKSEFDEFIMKVEVECFGYNLWDFKFMKNMVKIVIEV